MIKVRYEAHESIKSLRYDTHPEKYTVKGDVRVSWKKDIEKLIARAEQRVDALQSRIDSGDDYMPRSEFLNDAYGNGWELFYKSDGGNISGVLVEIA